MSSRPAFCRRGVPRVAILLDGVPADALEVKLASNRDAIYKTMFDARRKIRAALAANRHLDRETSRQR